MLGVIPAISVISNDRYLPYSRENFTMYMV
jgi:hypothetical protein